MRSKSLFLMLLCQSNMHSSNSFLFRISRWILCKEKLGTRHTLKCCISVPVLCCFGVVIKDSQLLLQLGTFCRGSFRCVGRLREWQEVIWSFELHLTTCRFVQEIVPLGFQCFSSLMPLLLCAETWLTHTVSIPSDYRASRHWILTQNILINISKKNMIPAKFCQVPQVTSFPKKRGKFLYQRVLEVVEILYLDEYLCECNMRQHPIYCTYPAVKYEGQSLYEADPSLNQRFFGYG